MHHESELRVRSYEMDALGHVNHAVYLNYFEQARYDALEAAGYTREDLLSRGWGVHVVRVEVDYRRECRQGDRLRIVTRAAEVRNSSATIVQELRRVDDGPEAEPAVTARVVIVWIGENGKPMRIPGPARAALEA